MTGPAGGFGPQSPRILIVDDDPNLLVLLADQMHEAHVNLIQHGRKLCHAQRPECGRCPVRPRCRYVDPKAP